MQSESQWQLINQCPLCGAKIYINDNDERLYENGDPECPHDWYDYDITVIEDPVEFKEVNGKD